MGTDHSCAANFVSAIDFSSTFGADKSVCVCVLKRAPNVTPVMEKKEMVPANTPSAKTDK